MLYNLSDLYPAIKFQKNILLSLSAETTRELF